MKVDVPGVGEVSALWQSPPQPSACLALAHGAGAGMTHRAMTAIADGLEGLGVATLRYQFPYMEKGSRRPDAPPVAHATVRAASPGFGDARAGCRFLRVAGRLAAG
jgi:predicted alpha/beta-hydrolase family hydrolase